MPLEFKTLANKRRILDKNSEYIVDLTESTLDPVLYKNIRITDVIVVAPDFVMRPELVALTVYGSSSDLDILLKFNSISNPYSLDAGQILLVPDKNDFFTKFRNNAAVIKDVNDIVFDKKKLPAKDLARLTFLQAKAAQQQNPGTVLPANFDDQGNREVSVRDGKIIFGENVSLPKDKCTGQTITRAEMKAKIMKDLIRNIT
jgi:hypothetical protein